MRDIIALQLLLPKVDHVENLIPRLEKNKILRKVDNSLYFFPFLYKPKRPMIEFIFSLYPKGLELYKEVDFVFNKLNIFFPGVFTEKDKKRSIAAVAGYSDKVLLWDWGKYLHVKYIIPMIEDFDFSTVVNYIDENLNDTQIDLESCFEEFETELVDTGIVSKYALHTCLKLKYPNDYAYQDSPWISKAGTERRELKETLKNLMTENRIYSLDELVELMHTNKVRVQQLIDNSEEVIQVRPFEYMKKKYLSISDEFFEKIVNYTNIKVQELSFIYVDLIVDKFSKELNDFVKYDLRGILLELLKKTSKEKKFNISNTRIIKKGYPITRDSLNFHILIGELIRNAKAISIDVIASYFIQRGLSKERIMAYFLYSKIKKIVRLDQETFTSIDKVGLTEKSIDNINLIMEDLLRNETHIDDIIKEYSLPKILLNWNRFLLSDILDHDKFLFLPSRENPVYIKKK